jgi:hypothetical protein
MRASRYHDCVCFRESQLVVKLTLHNIGLNMIAETAQHRVEHDCLYKRRYREVQSLYVAVYFW